MSKTKGKHHRQIKEAYLVPPPSGIAIKTRVVPSGPDELCLRSLADHLGTLAGKDLVNAQKTGSEAVSWPDRKKAISADSSSRWAGAISRENNDQISLAQRSQMAHRDEMVAVIATITRKLAVKVGKSAKIQVGSRAITVPGYHDQDEHWRKRQRLQILQGELARVEADISAGKLHIVRGGKRLFKLGQNLEAAGLSAEQYQKLWWAARHKIAANGSHDEMCGNLTIRVAPEGVCSILLPTALRNLSNTSDKKHYTLSAPVIFHYRQADWQAQLARGGALAYEIYYDAQKQRWYITAGWTLPEVAVAPAQDIQGLQSQDVQPQDTIAGEIKRLSALLPPAFRSVGVDINVDHLACWLVDASGNPVGRPIRIDLLLKGSSAKRDGHLRWAISQLLAFCRAHGASRIYIEDLNFSDGKSRENFGHRKQFRNTVSSFPTAKFKTRLQAMAHRAGIEVVAVDPAYTSKRSKPWINPTSTKTHSTTSHQAAGLAITRRGLSISLGRRKGVPLNHQRMVQGELPTGSRNKGASTLRDRPNGQRRPSQGATSPHSSPPRPIQAYLRPRTTVCRDPQPSCVVGE